MSDDMRAAAKITSEPPLPDRRGRRLIDASQFMKLPHRRTDSHKDVTGPRSWVSAGPLDERQRFLARGVKARFDNLRRRCETLAAQVPQ